jgi:1-acyl-sn-glycerol-3-phosphate acyltransferase
MLVLRSLVFNVAFYIVLAGLVIFGLPTLLIDRFAIFWLARLWTGASFWLLRVICGTRVEFRGVERIPPGACIVAPKHQSILDVFALFPFFPDFTFILKKELTQIPLFGWYLKRGELTAIDRSQGASALSQAKARAKESLARGRQLILYPEGTRRPPGAAPLYKFGIAHIYADNNVPCLPVAHNAGMFWGRRMFLRRPGTILFEFLPVIEAGLDAKTFYQRLQDELESATNRLIAETVARDPSLAATLATPEAPAPKPA